MVQAFMEQVSRNWAKHITSIQKETLKSHSGLPVARECPGAGKHHRTRRDLVPGTGLATRG